MEKRYIGIDLHRNRLTCCIRLENERTYVTEWSLEDLERFVKKLRPSDEVAVEITSNMRLFHDAVAPQVARVVVVDTNQFRVISQSVKKTDPNDARLLSLYLSKGLLPEVRMKDKEHGQTGENDPDAGHTGETADGAQEQGEQYPERAGAQPGQRSTVEREEAG